MSCYSGPMTRSRTRKRLETQSIHGDGEIVTSITNARWQDLEQTLDRNNWPLEFKNELIRVYRKDIKAKGFKIDDADWKNQVLPFAARDRRNTADWAEIVKSVLGADLKLEGLTQETMEWLHNLQETSKTNPAIIASLNRSIEMDWDLSRKIFKIYMLQFVQVLLSNIKVTSTAYKVASGTRKVGKYAGMALGATTLVALSPLIAVGHGLATFIATQHTSAPRFTRRRS